MKSILAKLKGGKKDSPSQEILVKNPFEDGQSDSGNSSGKSSQEHEKSNQLNADLEGDEGTTREGSQEFNGDVVEEETKNDTDVDDSSNPEVVIDSTNELKNVTILDKQGESEDASESSKKKIKEKKPKAKKELTIKQKKKLFLPKDIGLRKPKPPTNVLILNPKKHHQNSTLRKFIIVFVGLFYEYANITKVNGMYHLRKNVTTGWLRLLWSCIILSLLCFAGTLNYMLYRRYIDSPTRVTIAAPMPISSIPFPGVTICHPQNVMEYKSKEFVKKFKMPLGATPERVIEILPLLAGFTERQWAYPRVEDLEMIDNILDLNNMTVEKAIDALGTVCADFLLVCYFNGENFPCFQNHKFMTFVESYTYLGACCSFNYNPKANDQDEHFISNFFGINGGLNVIGTGRPQLSDGKSGAVYSEGFVVLVHHPNDFPVESSPTTYIQINKETFIDVQPIESSCSNQVLNLDFEQRKCIIPSDLNVKSYRQPECMLGCLRDEIHKRCHCHPFHLPKSDNTTTDYRGCKAKDIMCFVENYFEFKTVKCDHCFPSCTDIVYKSNSFDTSYTGLIHSINPFYFETNMTSQEFIVRVYFGGPMVARNRKIVVMSWISMLSNLGGSFALCLGISMLSFFEVFYFLTFRLFRHCKRAFRDGPVMPKFTEKFEKY